MIIKSFKYIQSTFLLIIKTILFLLLLAFAVKNTEIVHIQYYLGFEFDVPLILVIMISFAIGGILGGFANLGFIFKARNVGTLERKLKKTEQELSSAKSA